MTGGVLDESVLRLLLSSNSSLQQKKLSVVARRAGGTTDSRKFEHFKDSCGLAYFKILFRLRSGSWFEEQFSNLCFSGPLNASALSGVPVLAMWGGSVFGEGSGQGYSRNGLPSRRPARVRRLHYVSTRMRVTDSLERYEGRMDQ